jgi:hypothetical protein
MITQEMSNKALEIYWRLYTGKEKPPRRGTKLWNQQARVLGDILEGVRPDIEEAHLERLVAQAKGKIIPFRKTA